MNTSVDNELSPHLAHRRPGLALRTWRGFLKAPISAKFGFLVIFAYVFIALFAPLLTPYGESQIVGAEFELWSEEFPLGTDNLGRDMLTRLFFGARNTVGIAFITTCLAFAIGGSLGVLAALLRGWVDQVLSRIVDVLMAIPLLIFALLLLTIFGTSIQSIIIVIAVLDSTRVFRLARAVSLNVVVLDFVEAARLRGERMGWLTFREVLPNIICLLYTSPSPRDATLSRMPSSA